MDEHGIEEHTKTEGYNAAYNGVNISKNPYIDPPFATWWREGFLMAVYETNGDDNG
jgi:hypothetical protein